MIKKFSLAVLSILLCAFFAACGDDNSTSTDQHEHFEVEGWNLYWPDWSLAYSVYRGKIDEKHNELHVNANCLSEHLNIKFLDENKNEIAFKDGISKSKVAYAKIVFRFNFDLRPDYRLEFVAALRKKLAELPSDAHVRLGFDSDVFLEWLVDLRR